MDNRSGECECVEVSNPGSMMERRYAYDNNRNLLSISSPNTPWYNQTFAYDGLNRLISAEGRYGSESYTHDRVGNRLTRMVNGETENYAYTTGTNKLQAITGANPTQFIHDANGNITGMGNKVLTYNQDNRLIKVEAAGNTLGEYTYNGLGQRVKKVADGVTTIFHYDMDGNLIAESRTDGTMTKEYLYMGKIRMAMADVASNKMSYFLNDHLGTPQLMTNDQKVVVWEAIYRPFGEAAIHPNASVVNNLRFPGQYYDQETGFHYNYHRYYDPMTGRYLRPDPMGLVGGINLFIYAENNPIILTDAYGLFSLKDVLRSPRVTAVISLGASKLAEYAATKMEPGKARGAVYVISGGLAFASAYTAMQVSVGAYVVAATTSPSVVGAVVGYSVGTGFAILALYDIYTASEYFEKAMQDFSYIAPVDANSCE